MKGRQQDKAADNEHGCCSLCSRAQRASSPATLKRGSPERKPWNTDCWGKCCGSLCSASWATTPEILPGHQQITTRLTLYLQHYINISCYVYCTMSSNSNNYFKHFTYEESIVQKNTSNNGRSSN